MRMPASVIALVLVCLGLLAHPTSASSHGKPPSPSTASQGGYGKTATIAGASAIGSEECANCHREATAFRLTIHAHAGIACESCHGPGSLHADDDKGHGHIHAFIKEAPEDANGICLTGC